MEDDEAGRLAGFRARFGRGYESVKASITPQAVEGDSAGSETENFVRKPLATMDSKLEDHGFDDDEEDNNILEMISSYGKAKGSPRSGAKKDEGKS
jgi:hypothetical protein